MHCIKIIDNHIAAISKIAISAKAIYLIMNSTHNIRTWE